jgi:hypothetical protein
MKICIRILLFCAVCCFVFSQVYASERVIYRGTLKGAGEVIMELQASGGGNYAGGIFIRVMERISPWKENSRS